MAKRKLDDLSRKEAIRLLKAIREDVCRPAMSAHGGAVVDNVLRGAIKWGRKFGIRDGWDGPVKF